MKLKLLYLALAALTFSACHHEGTANMPETVIDTTNHTHSIDSDGKATNTGAPADSTSRALDSAVRTK